MKTRQSSLFNAKPNCAPYYPTQKKQNGRKSETPAGQVPRALGRTVPDVVRKARRPKIGQPFDHLPYWPGFDTHDADKTLRRATGVWQTEPGTRCPQNSHCEHFGTPLQHLRAHRLEHIEAPQHGRHQQAPLIFVKNSHALSFSLRFIKKPWNREPTRYKLRHLKLYSSER